MNHLGNRSRKTVDKWGVCEPLRGKKRNVWNYCGDIISISDFQSAVEFYKKYRLRPIALQKEKPELWSKFIKYAISKYPKLLKGIKDEYDTCLNVALEYWLFDYCFGDVTG